MGWPTGGTPGLLLNEEPGVVLDYDAHDHVVGVEMLQLSRRSPKADLQRLLFETLSTPPSSEAVVRETPPPYGSAG
ncbi:MAG: DUF2283 domain-containing protein [Candidatus Hydrogenedentes bacterium]|nr:DUF2283 domain-containing protein [Candidatus Hydrogenedentota bacterium]